MKRKLLLLFVVLFLPLSSADAGRLEVSRQSRGYRIDISIDPDPPRAIGENNIEIEIEDCGGRKITDARVIVNYYMPPMPRMAPMNYKTDAGLKKGKYRAVMKFIMAGPWYVAVIVQHEGKTSSVRVNVDAQ